MDLFLYSTVTIVSVSLKKEVCDVEIPTDRGFVFNSYILSF